MDEFVLIAIVLIFGCIGFTIFIFAYIIPLEYKQSDELKNMPCDEIKQHIEKEDYGWITYQKYQSEFMVKCLK